MAEALDDGGEGNSPMITPEPLSASEAKGNVAFLKEVQDAHETLQNLKSLVLDLKRRQNMILRVVPPEHSMKQELQTIRDEITLLATELCRKLSSIEPIEGGDDAECVPGNIEMQKTQHAVLVKESWELIVHLDAIKAEYRDRNVERIRQQLKTTGTDETDQALDEMLKTDTQSVLNVVKAKQEALKEVEFRHDEIVKLEQSTKALHEMFPRLAVRVEDLVDGMESSNSQWKSYVKKAKGNLKESVMYHEKTHKLISHRRKIWLAICLTILLLIVAIILAVTFT